MGRGTTRRPRQKQRGGPSLFFLIALAIGIAILAWVVITTIRKPAVRTGAKEQGRFLSAGAKYAGWSCMVSDE